MTDATWKQCERAIARRLNGQRTGPTGRSGADVTTDWLAVEVKSRRTLPAWLLRALAQARHGCPEHRLPLVVLHQVGQRHNGDVPEGMEGELRDQEIPRKVNESTNPQNRPKRPERYDRGVRRCATRSP